MLKKSLSASKTHLMFLQPGDQSDDFQIGSKDGSLNNTVTDKFIGQEMGKSSKIQAEKAGKVSSDVSLPFIFPKSIAPSLKSIPKIKQASERSINDGGAQIKYMLKAAFRTSSKKQLNQGSKSYRIDHKKSHMKSAMKTVN